MKPMILRNLTIALTSLLIVSSAASAGDWNQWRGPNRDGVAPSSPDLIESLPAGGLKPVWKSESIPSARDGGWGSPAVVGDRVYLYVHQKTKLFDSKPKKFPWLPPDKRSGMTDEEYAAYERNRRDEDEARAKAYRFDEIVYCLDARTGKTLWKNEKPAAYSRFPQSGSPAVVDGKLYVLGSARTARCVDAVTGKDVWTRRLPGEFRDEFMESSFAIADGVAAVLCGRLFGLDADTGEILWQGDLKQTGGTHTSPVVWEVDEGWNFVVNVSGGYTACFKPQTGEELWRVKSEARLSTPVVVGDRLITYGSSRKVGLRCYRMDEDGVEELWTSPGVADKGSSPVVLSGHVYIQGDKRLACVDLETGKREWSATLDLARPQYTSPVAADGKVFYARDGLLCVAADPQKYTPLIEAKLNESGLMATEPQMRKLLGLADLEKQKGGQEKALRLYDKAVGKHGPLECATPAIADGRLYIRLPDALVCYDFRSEKRATTKQAEK